MYTHTHTSNRWGGIRHGHDPIRTLLTRFFHHKDPQAPRFKSQSQIRIESRHKPMQLEPKRCKNQIFMLTRRARIGIDLRKNSKREGFRSYINVCEMMSHAPKGCIQEISKDFLGFLNIYEHLKAVFNYDKFTLYGSNYAWAWVSFVDFLKR